MLFLSPKQKAPPTRRSGQRRLSFRRWRLQSLRFPGWQPANKYEQDRRPRLNRFLLLALFVLILAACAPGDPPPPAICDTYERALFTIQLMAGASLLLALAVLGFRKNLSAIIPSQGAQIGTFAGSIGLGLALIAFSTDIGNQVLTGFGIESLYTLCGLG